MNEQILQETQGAATETRKPETRAKRPLLPVSIALLAVSAGLSGYLKFEIWNNESQTAEIRKELAEFETQISTLKSDPAVAAADLLNRNKASLEKDVERSQAQTYVSEFMKLHRDYDVDFDGFQFSGGKIITIVSATQSSPGTDPIDKVIRLVGDFRSGSGTAAVAPFSLSEIKLVS